MAVLHAYSINFSSMRETALVALLDYLSLEQDRDSTSVLALPDFSVAFDTINHELALWVGNGQHGIALIHFLSMVRVAWEP